MTSPWRLRGASIQSRGSRCGAAEPAETKVDAPTSIAGWRRRRFHQERGDRLGKPPPKPIASPTPAGKKAKTVGRGLNFDAEVEDDDPRRCGLRRERRSSAAATTTNVRSEAGRRGGGGYQSERARRRPDAEARCEAGGRGQRGRTSRCHTVRDGAGHRSVRGPDGHETPVADENADTSPWGFEPVESTQRTAVDRRRRRPRAHRPKHVCSTAPAKKNPVGALANLSAGTAAKENPMEMKQAVKTYVMVAKGPRPARRTSPRIRRRGAWQLRTGTQAKKATIAQFFNPGAKRAAEEVEETMIHRISDARRPVTRRKS